SGRTSRRVFFRRLFVGMTAIIGGVESGPFEDQSRSSAEQTLDLAATPFFLAAKVLRTFAKWFIAHGLVGLKILATLFAEVFVSGHSVKNGGAEWLQLS